MGSCGPETGPECSAADYSHFSLPRCSCSVCRPPRCNTHSILGNVGHRRRWKITASEYLIPGVSWIICLHAETTGSSFPIMHCSGPPGFCGFITSGVIRATREAGDIFQQQHRRSPHPLALLLAGFSVENTRQRAHDTQTDNSLIYRHQTETKTRFSGI